VTLLDPHPGERILETCAAPGGKTTAIGERLGADGQVIALDRHARRLDLVRRHVRRLGIGCVLCVERDAARPFPDLAESRPFDRVLVDAPCSGLGTLRRNPDARWRVGPGDPLRLAEVQLPILRNAAAVLRPGGVLVYSTCTLLREENEDVVEAFLENEPQFLLSSAPEAPAAVRPLIGDDGLLHCLPHLHDTDGFFAARLVRRA
jgi:16S rRNA (cytosine967-C5)-methyltransferase